MKHPTFCVYGIAIILFAVVPGLGAIACGVCEPSDGAAASLSGLGLLHLVCCGSLLIIGLFLLLFRKSDEHKS